MNGTTSQPPTGPFGASLSIEEVAASLAISPEGVMRYIRAGDLPHLRVPGSDAIEFRVLPEDVQALRARLDPAVREPSESRAALDAVLIGRAGGSHELEALAPLLAAHERLVSENARLHEVLRAQAERIASLERAARTGPDEAAEIPSWAAYLQSLPEAMADLGVKVQALQEELAWLRERRDQADNGAFQQAWRRIQRRPWWADLLD